MSSLPSRLTVVFAWDCLHSAMLCRHIVSLHSTLLDYCTVRYGTGRVGRYCHVYAYLHTTAFDLTCKTPAMVFGLTWTFRTLTTVLGLTWTFRTPTTVLSLTWTFRTPTSVLGLTWTPQESCSGPLSSPQSSF